MFELRRFLFSDSLTTVSAVCVGVVFLLLGVGYLGATWILLEESPADIKVQ
jgi:hypothetical protein